MMYTKKRVQLELSDRQLKYIESVAIASGETVSDVIKDFFYFYLQNRMCDSEIVVIPIK